ncbi:hypothetical protein GJ496_000975 [Pomphorhynchus laevis]|nr:hypothetical protein GJ496_000975 [Pomphorhynchus laevis]
MYITFALDHGVIEDPQDLSDQCRTTMIFIQKPNQHRFLIYANQHSIDIYDVRTDEVSLSYKIYSVPVKSRPDWLLANSKQFQICAIWGNSVHLYNVEQINRTIKLTKLHTIVQLDDHDDEIIKQVLWHPTDPNLLYVFKQKHMKLISFSKVTAEGRTRVTITSKQTNKEIVGACFRQKCIFLIVLLNNGSCLYLNSDLTVVGRLRPFTKILKERDNVKLRSVYSLFPNVILSVTDSSELIAHDCPTGRTTKLKLCAFAGIRSGGGAISSSNSVETETLTKNRQIYFQQLDKNIILVGDSFSNEIVVIKVHFGECGKFMLSEFQCESLSLPITSDHSCLHVVRQIIVIDTAVYLLSSSGQVFPFYFTFGDSFPLIVHEFSNNEDIYTDNQKADANNSSLETLINQIQSGMQTLYLFHQKQDELSCNQLQECVTCAQRKLEVINDEYNKHMKDLILAVSSTASQSAMLSICKDYMQNEDTRRNRPAISNRIHSKSNQSFRKLNDLEQKIQVIDKLLSSNQNKVVALLSAQMESLRLSRKCGVVGRMCEPPTFAKDACTLNIATKTPVFYQQDMIRDYNIISVMPKVPHRQNITMNPYCDDDWEVVLISHKSDSTVIQAKVKDEHALPQTSTSAQLALLQQSEKSIKNQGFHGSTTFWSFTENSHQDHFGSTNGLESSNSSSACDILTNETCPIDEQDKQNPLINYGTNVSETRNFASIAPIPNQTDTTVIQQASFSIMNQSPTYRQERGTTPQSQSTILDPIEMSKIKEETTQSRSVANQLTSSIKDQLSISSTISDKIDKSSLSDGPFKISDSSFGISNFSFNLQEKPSVATDLNKSGTNFINLSGTKSTHMVTNNVEIDTMPTAMLPKFTIDNSQSSKSSNYIANDIFLPLPSRKSADELLSLFASISGKSAVTSTSDQSTFNLQSSVNLSSITKDKTNVSSDFASLSSGILSNPATSTLPSSTTASPPKAANSKLMFQFGMNDQPPFENQFAIQNISKESSINSLVKNQDPVPITFLSTPLHDDIIVEAMKSTSDSLTATPDNYLPSTSEMAADQSSSNNLYIQSEMKQDTLSTSLQSSSQILNIVNSKTTIPSTSSNSLFQLAKTESLPVASKAFLHNSQDKSSVQPVFSSSSSLSTLKCTTTSNSASLFQFGKTDQELVEKKLASNKSKDGRSNDQSIVTPNFSQPTATTLSVSTANNSPFQFGTPNQSPLSNTNSQNKHQDATIPSIFTTSSSQYVTTCSASTANTSPFQFGTVEQSLFGKQLSQNSSLQDRATSLVSPSATSPIFSTTSLSVNKFDTQTPDVPLSNIFCKQSSSNEAIKSTASSVASVNVVESLKPTVSSPTSTSSILNDSLSSRLSKDNLQSMPYIDQKPDQFVNNEPIPLFDTLTLDNAKSSTSAIPATTTSYGIFGQVNIFQCQSISGSPQSSFFQKSSNNATSFNQLSSNVAPSKPSNIFSMSSASNSVPTTNSSSTTFSIPNMFPIDSNKTTLQTTNTSNIVFPAVKANIPNVQSLANSSTSPFTLFQNNMSSNSLSTATGMPVFSSLFKTTNSSVGNSPLFTTTDTASITASSAFGLFSNQSQTGSSIFSANSSSIEKGTKSIFDLQISSIPSTSSSVNSAATLFSIFGSGSNKSTIFPCAATGINTSTSLFGGSHTSTPTFSPNKPLFGSSLNTITGEPNQHHSSLFGCTSQNTFGGFQNNFSNLSQPPISQTQSIDKPFSIFGQSPTTSTAASSSLFGSQQFGGQPLFPSNKNLFGNSNSGDVFTASNNSKSSSSLFGNNPSSQQPTSFFKQSSEADAQAVREQTRSKYSGKSFMNFRE